MEKKQNKKVILGVVAFIAVVAILGAVYYFTRPETQKGAKEVAITVVSEEGKKTEYEIHTDAEYLQGAMVFCASVDKVSPPGYILYFG